MEIVHSGDLTYDQTKLQHRGSGLAFKDLFLGDETDVPNNYYFILARQSRFYSPVHRHNFDQFRFPTLGDINILPDLNVRQGELCYHPEGVPYGPQDDGEASKEVLVLQFGGASGQGFLSHAQLRETQTQLAEKGRFDKGKYYRQLDEGEAEPVDSFQALWEHQMGKPLVYPQGRYDRVVNMHPDAYGWKAVENHPGVWKKTLGVFSERETRAEMIKIEKSVWKVPPECATQLFFVLKGDGTADGNPFKAESAGRLRLGVAGEIGTETEIEMLRFVMPLV